MIIQVLNIIFIMLWGKEYLCACVVFRYAWVSHSIYDLWTTNHIFRYAAGLHLSGYYYSWDFFLYGKISFFSCLFCLVALHISQDAKLTNFGEPWHQYWMGFFCRNAFYRPLGAFSKVLPDNKCWTTFFISIFADVSIFATMGQNIIKDPSCCHSF